MRRILWVIVYGLMASGMYAQAAGDIPIIKVSPVQSSITFAVKASVPIEGTFSSWDAKLTFTSDHVEDGALDIKIQAASVNTGSRIKNDRLKSKDFFDSSQDPYITFHSSKIVQTGQFTFDLPGTFTIRGVSKPETLTFTGKREGNTHAEIKGSMAFDRKEFGMDSGIPFIRIADRVEVNVDLNVDRVSGPPILFKQQP
jgi:polyisoprenoid-binding protein YceI